MQSIIVDHTLADAGARRIDWARANMPIVVSLAEEFRQSRPFENLKIGIL